MQLPRYRPILGGRESERLPTNLREIESIISLSASSMERYLADLDRTIISVAYAASPVMADLVLAGSGITVNDNGDGTITIAQGAGAVTGSAVAGQVTYWSAASVLTGNANFTFSLGGAGTTSLVTVKNPSNTGSAHSGIDLVGGGASGGDAFVRFDCENAGGGTFLYTDNSDGNRFKISLGALGTGTTLFSLDPAIYAIGIGYEMTTQLTGSITAEIKLGCTFGNSPAVVTVINPNYGAILQIVAGGGQDARLQFGSSSWALGRDASDSGAFTIDTGNSLGGATKLKITTAGIITLPTTTDASSLTTGALVLSGGLGVAKKLYLGDDLHLATGKAYRVNGVQVLTNQQAGLGANIAAATAGAAYTATEQAMLQALNDKMVALEPMLKTHGLVAT